MSSIFWEHPKISVTEVQFWTDAWTWTSWTELQVQFKVQSICWTEPKVQFKVQPVIESSNLNQTLAEISEQLLNFRLKFLQDSCCELGTVSEHQGLCSSLV